MKLKNEGNIKYPSARLKGLKEFMTFIQEPDWKPDKIDANLMKRLGMAKGRENEAVYALLFLDIIDLSGKPTVEFDNLKTDYSGTFSKLIKNKYKELFSLLPARLINQEKLVKFFATSTETAEYQAKLFSWFCGQSGIELPNLETKIHRARFNKKKKEND